MSYIDAIFRHGVFQPLAPVHLPDNQRVRLNFESAVEETPQSWLQHVRRLHTALVARTGTFPDSTGDIAADRLR